MRDDMIDQIEMMRLIENLRGDAIVVPAMRANVGWSQVSNNIDRDVPASGAMGKTCSFALGLALARPETKIIVFDGDGSLLMNLGALVTTATKAPKNFIILLWIMECTLLPGAKRFREPALLTTLKWGDRPDMYIRINSII